MLKPKVDVNEFEKYGFKKCKGAYGENGSYYLCVSRGIKMIFLSCEMIDVIPWTDGDERIHNKPNCRYRYPGTYLDILYELIKADLIESVLP